MTSTQEWINAQRAEGRRLRDAARAVGERYVKAGIRHGIYGYQTHCCDCIVCRTANANRISLWRTKKWLGVS